jgi:anti-anti-sigma factor
MKVKTDTKEKFHVINVETPFLTANMAADLYQQIVPILQSNIVNVVLNLKNVEKIDEGAADVLVKMQQRFYEENASFVICELTPEVEDFLEQTERLEMMNITPTESEAMDIVQMEEIERDLFDEEEA